MNEARELVRSALDDPGMLDPVADEDDLSDAGVASAELLRLGLACEDRLGRAITADELDRLVSIAAVQVLLDGDRGPQP